jgi:hypothetical protein
LTTSTRTLRNLLSLSCVLLCTATSFASALTGVVTDRTTGKPSVGDTIAVINTAKSMDEIAKATSDASGRFHVDAPDGGQTLLHITHRGAEYFKSVPPGSSSVEIDVYDSAVKVAGIAGEALVLRAETDPSGKTLNLAENFFVQNAATPPRTEVGGNTFDFYLPKGAEIAQTIASTTGGLPTNVEVKTLDAASGHYAFTFPIRPGETRFQVVYSLPYNGSQSFSLKLTVPTGDVAVMLPKSMQFAGSAQFQPLNQDPSALTYDAHQPDSAQPVEFSIHGSGQLPQTQDDVQGGSQAMASGNGSGAAVSSSGARPGGGLGAPGDPEGQNDPWARNKWLVLGVLGLALILGAGFMLKTGQAAPTIAGAAQPIPPASASTTTVQITAAAPTADLLLQALRDELFALETDHLAGRLSDAQYAEQKSAFDIVLRRALSRSAVASTAFGNDAV